MSNLSVNDIRAVFANVHGGAPLPSHLKFQVVSLRSWCKMTPPSVEFEPGLYILVKPQKRGVPCLIPSRLMPFVMGELVTVERPWRMYGPRKSSPSGLNQRLCYPKGIGKYSDSIAGSVWTIVHVDGWEDLEYRLLHVYVKPALRRSSERSSTVLAANPPKKRQSRVGLSSMRSIKSAVSRNVNHSDNRPPRMKQWLGGGDWLDRRVLAPPNDGLNSEIASSTARSTLTVGQDSSFKVPFHRAAGSLKTLVSSPLIHLRNLPCDEPELVPINSKHQATSVLSSLVLDQHIDFHSDSCSPLTKFNASQDHDGILSVMPVFVHYASRFGGASLDVPDLATDSQPSLSDDGPRIVITGEQRIHNVTRQLDSVHKSIRECMVMDPDDENTILVQSQLLSLVADFSQRVTVEMMGEDAAI